jgi:hypothetical protein
MHSTAVSSLCCELTGAEAGGVFSFFSDLDDKVAVHAGEAEAEKQY